MKKRNSRWDDEPRLDKSGQPIIVYPCAGDFVIFRLLNRYRYLPINFIAEHTGFSYSYLKHRLDLLARKPNKYLHRPEKQQVQPNANYRFLIYELSERGETILKDHNLYSAEHRLGDEHMFAHSLMVSETIASLDMAVTGVNTGTSMIWWPEIAGRLTDPHRFIPVHIEHQFDKVKKNADFDYYNDSNGPFGIKYPDGTARFLSLEAEHTNQVDCSNLTKTSFLKKFLAIKYIMENQLHTEALGLAEPHYACGDLFSGPHRHHERPHHARDQWEGRGLHRLRDHPRAGRSLQVGQAHAGAFHRRLAAGRSPGPFLNSPTARRRQHRRRPKWISIY